MNIAIRKLQINTLSCLSESLLSNSIARGLCDWDSGPDDYDRTVAFCSDAISDD